MITGWLYNPSVFSQLGKIFFLTRQLFFPNWEKIIARLASAFTSFEEIRSVRFFFAITKSVSRKSFTTIHSYPSA